MNNIIKIKFESHGDDRGQLVAIENNLNIPFEIKRVYYIFDTINSISRGCHAHRNMKQVLICLSGSCDIAFNDGIKEELVTLNSKTEGILIDGFIWREMKNFSRDCLLMCLTDKLYKDTEYIRDFDLFKKMVDKGVY